MKVIEPFVEKVLFYIPEDGQSIEEAIELNARNCYKSEDKITTDSAQKLIRMLRDRGHHAMLEFGYATAHVVGDRGNSHETVRHRLASFAQESTRYCNYSKNKFASGITIIEQPWKVETSSEKYKKFAQAAEDMYIELLADGESAQLARAVLPIGLKAEIIIGANLREWRHIFQMRCAKTAHPIIRNIMLEVLRQFNNKMPSIYEDLAEKFLNE